MHPLTDLWRYLIGRVSPKRHNLNKLDGAFIISRAPHDISCALSLSAVTMEMKQVSRLQISQIEHFQRSPSSKASVCPLISVQVLRRRADEGVSVD